MLGCRGSPQYGKDEPSNLVGITVDPMGMRKLFEVIVQRIIE
jgi:hypothetical protein